MWFFHSLLFCVSNLILNTIRVRSTAYKALANLAHGYDFHLVPRAFRAPRQRRPLFISVHGPTRIYLGCFALPVLPASTVSLIPTSMHRETFIDATEPSPPHGFSRLLQDSPPPPYVCCFRPPTPQMCVSIGYSIVFLLLLECKFHHNRKLIFFSLLPSLALRAAAGTQSSSGDQCVLIN